MGCKVAAWRCVLCCREYQVALEHWRLKGVRSVCSLGRAFHRLKGPYYLDGSPETHDDLF